jgi:ketosteroid isomerase-like protein
VVGSGHSRSAALHGKRNSSARYCAAMSKENVDRLQSAIDAFNERDGSTFDRLLAADAEILPVRAALEGTTYRGKKAGSQYCLAVEETWESLRWEVDEIRGVGELAVAVGHIRGKGRATGATIDTSGGWVAQFRDGLITRFRTYTNRGDALEAAGLSE